MISVKNQIVRLVFGFCVMASLAFFFLASLKSEASNPKPLRASLLALAVENGWQGYTYSGPNGEMPVLAVNRTEHSQYLKLLDSQSVSFVYNRKTFHSYIRVGGVLFDMWGVGQGSRVPRVHVRSAAAVFATSKSSRWIEAVLAVDPGDISTLLQFYFYRSAILETETMDSKHPWFKEFVDRGTPPFRQKENCTGFVLSAFNSVFFENMPSVESLESVQAIARSLASKVGVSLKFDPVARFLADARKLASKYREPMVAAPPGLMRLTNQSKNGVAFVIHNVDPKETFIKNNSMNFEAKYGVEEAIDEGFDDLVRARKPIANGCAARVTSSSL